MRGRRNNAAHLFLFVRKIDAHRNENPPEIMTFVAIVMQFILKQSLNMNWTLFEIEIAAVFVGIINSYLGH